MSRDQDYITEVRVANRKIWEGVNSLQALQREYNARVYGTNLDDGIGENEGITKDEVGPVVFAAAAALGAVLDGGVGGNMAKLL